MSVLIVGSVAFDTIETPFERRERVLGGSCTYSAIAASLFTDVSIVAVVGEDFKEEHFKILTDKKIDTSGVKREKGKSFFWEGRYHMDMNLRDTIKTELNVFENFEPVISDEHREKEFLFLANIDPVLQMKVLDSMKRLKFSLCDTMNLWIEIKKKELIQVFKRVDCVVLNDFEVRQFSGVPNLILGAREIRKLGPKYVIIKKGEHGATLIGPEGLYFSIPSYPVENVIDPTGAGDSFAGAFIGFLAKEKNIDERNLKKAIVYGNVVASYTVEGFGIDRLYNINMNDINNRINSIKKCVEF
ncbi:MAG: PfkB family carbohydrate kinase [Candidatus Goldbacteria bacterium]|nr:PfkB family carbohydrate kinase [Candidatus Goldiibacteriota bacterium]